MQLSEQFIRDTRRARKISQVRLAASIGARQSDISRIERGESPALKDFQRISAILRELGYRVEIVPDWD